jgi:hypothetical protein
MRFGFLACVVGCLAACGVPQGGPIGPVTDDFEAYSAWTWEQGDLVGPWQVAWDGYGEIGVVAGALKLTPATASWPLGAHSALVQTTRTFDDPVFTVRMNTVEQLRVPEPWAWEVGQVFWNRSSNGTAYYFAMKTNGAEFGEVLADGTFDTLWTDTANAVQLGDWNDVEVSQQGNQTTIWVNSVHLLTYKDPTPLSGGHIGLYAGDSSVLFDDFWAND